LDSSHNITFRFPEPAKEIPGVAIPI